MAYIRPATIVALLDSWGLYQLIQGGVETPQCTGGCALHRLSEGNLPSIAKNIESLYGVSARAELTSALTQVVLDATLLPTRAPPRVLTDVALLTAVLHCRIGSEVMAAFLQELVDRYHQLFADARLPEAGKQLDNALLLLAQLYNFKAVLFSFLLSIFLVVKPF